METTAVPVFKAFGEEILLTGINLPDKISINHPLPENLKNISKAITDENSVSILVGDKTLYRNKEILCARIPYFRALFESDLSECTSKEIRFSNPLYAFDLSIIQRLLDYASSGHLTITVKNVQDLMSAANFLQMESVMDECAQFMRRRLTIDNVLPMFSFCKTIGYGKIDSYIRDFIDNNFVPISLTIEFLQISVEDLSDVLQRSSLNVEEEKQIFVAVNRWIRNDTNRKVHAARLLKCIRCTLLTDTFLKKTVARAKWIRGNQECIGLVKEAMDYVNKRQSSVQSFMTSERYCEKATELFVSFDRPGKATDPKQKICIHIYNPFTDNWTESKIYSVPQRTEYISLLDNKLSLSRNKNVFTIIDAVSNTQHTGKEYIKQNKPKEHVPVFPIKGRSRPARGYIKGKIYAAGGRDSNAMALSALDVFDETIKAWVSLTPMSKPRYDPGFWSRRGKFYVVGGSDNFGECLNDGEVYDPQTDRWTPISSMLFKRRSCEVRILNGTVFVVGGIGSGGALSVVERYDCITDTWTTLAPMRTPRYNFSIGFSCGKMFAFGGSSQSRNSVEMYDPDKNTWEDRADFPVTRDISLAVPFSIPASIPKAVPNLEEHWINRFRAFSLKEELIIAIVDCGFRYPREVQTECLPPAIEGRDVLCQSDAKTGQTTMQAIAVLQQLKPIDGEESALFVCSTREKTTNTEQKMKLLSRYFENIKIASFVGGTSIKKDAAVLNKDQPHIVIGTPARIIALVQSGSLDLNNIKHLVIDDADNIISDNGICTIVEKIFNSSSKNKQVIITTNNMSNQLRRFCEKFMESKPRRFEFIRE